MALFWRIWGAAIGVTILVVALFVTLATLQFNQVNTELVAERLAVLGHRTASPFEAAAEIGLPLSTVRNASALLERARQTDDAITAIHVFDRDGTVIHSTDRSPPQSILQVQPSAMGDGPPFIETEGGFDIRIDIGGRDGQPVGGILVGYSGSQSITRVRAMAAELAFLAILALVATAVIGTPLMRIALARQVGEFEAINHAVTGFERDFWCSTADSQLPSVDKDPSDNLRGLLDAAAISYRKARAMIVDGA